MYLIFVWIVIIYLVILLWICPSSLLEYLRLEDNGDFFLCPPLGTSKCFLNKKYPKILLNKYFLNKKYPKKYPKYPKVYILYILTKE